MRRFLGSLKQRVVRRLFWTAEQRRHVLVGPQDLWEQKRAFQVEFLTGRGLQPHHHLLDLGCGTLRGGIPLIEILEPEHYTGLEARAEVLEEARQELADAGLEHKRPRLVAAELPSRSGIAEHFDYVWSFSVLIHMADEILFDALGFVAGRLAPGGVFYANVNVGERDEGFWQGFPVVWRSLDFYRESCARAGLRLEDLGPLGELGHVSGVASQDAQRMLEIRSAGE